MNADLKLAQRKWTPKLWNKLPNYVTPYENRLPKVELIFLIIFIISIIINITIYDELFLFVMVPLGITFIFAGMGIAIHCFNRYLDKSKNLLIVLECSSCRGI